ncbi:MAG: HesA/MoeB/ThiF family protein [Syntrophorhabdaceae bacterium]|nr:HesA/MoeB/ThiF family protein [Syntrophorhabdaceae bacterium]
MTEGKKRDGQAIHFSAEEIQRYSRQMMIPAIGLEGQERLKKSKVCIAGAGGLGSVSAYYLAAAGVGCIRLVDRDRVELSNLNRQILHFTGDLGEPKVLSALDKLERLNPNCRVEALQADINEGNIFEVIGDCQVIIDALDNIRTRRILNLATVRSRIPLIYGGVEAFSGMASTFISGETPCFECLFSHISEEEKAKGVVGPVPALIGSIQALEAIKILLGDRPSLAGTLLYFSGMSMTFQNILVERNPLCPICGQPPVEA